MRDTDFIAQLLLNSIVIDAQSVSGSLVDEKEILSVLLMWYCYLPKIHLLCKVQLAMNKEFSA